MHTLTIAVLGTLLFGASTAGSLASGPQKFKHEPGPVSREVDPRALEHLDSLLRSMAQENKLSSVAAFVAKGGEVVYHKAHGWKNVEDKLPASVEDYYVLFSQTKAVTTVAFMTLVEEGLVAIDDPVAKYFPEIPQSVVTAVNPDGTFETRPAKTTMTFVHLMSHTSGLGAGLVRDIRRAKGAGNDAPVGFGGPLPKNAPAGQRTGGVDPTSHYLEDEMKKLARYPLGFDPGSRWDYHVSTNMLAYLIERISGRPLREYVKEKVLLPLGMDQTDWFYEPEALNRFVKAYRLVDGKLQPGPNLYSEGAVSRVQTYAEGAIGLNGPIEDYAKFCQMLLNKGEFNGRRILRSDTVELMTGSNRLAGATGAEAGFQFGLGFELHRVKKPVPAVSNSAFAWGGMLGTNYLIDPENDLIALVYLNMYQAPSVYPAFLDAAYGLFKGSPGKDSAATPEETPRRVVEKGGTGPYPAIVTEDSTLPGMTIYRPRDLGAFGPNLRLPVLLWGNGACANTTEEHKNFLNEIASHGYLVLGIGRLDQLETRGDASRHPTSSKQLIGALDWIASQNKTPGGEFHGKVDLAKVAAMGMSCGGLQAIEISSDPRITTTVVCNSGVLPSPSPRQGMPPVTKDALAGYHGPVLYIMGGPSDIAYNNAMDDFARVNHVPIVMTNLDVGHGGTYRQPRGGEFTRVALAWLNWHLKNQHQASQMFLGENSDLKRDSNWTIEVKNFSDATSTR